MKVFNKFFIAITAAVLFSCTENGIEPDHNNVALGLSLAQNSVTPAKGEMFVNVTASGDWTLKLEFEEDAEAWAALSRTSGTGSRNGIILSYNALGTSDSRSLTVVLTDSGKGTQKTATLTQSKSGASTGGKLLDVANVSWLELPATKAGDGLEWGLVKNSSTKCGRNYSYEWDYENLVARWVAYPLNRGLIGSGSRTNEWGLDPNLPASQQPVLYRGFKGGFDRGHQMPSADRLNHDDNVQTFYGVNMTPQLGPRFNQSIWGDLENKVRGWASTCDTLYVVTGCNVGPDSCSGTYGEVGGYALDNNGKRVAVPTAYWKAVLKYNSSNMPHYSACGVYLEHMDYSSSSISSSAYVSIDRLEELTGLDFFVNLPKKIGEAEAAKIEAQTPGSSWK